ncbi:MAG: protein kinase [Acidobacteriota bacterium]|nr:protein kinase [Acidobacteriota bacterium]
MNQEPLPQMNLSHYRLVSKIGAGGMGEVYRARDERLGRDVAIKVLPADFANAPDRLKRFEQEARATSALNHPNILTVYDIGTHEGAPYLVAELLEGEELRAQLNDGALPVKRAIEYAQQIAAGLAAAHEKGIVHRDLKPENLFVTKDGRVKILDFGLAKLKPQTMGGGVDSEAATLKPLTNPGVILGTVSYMSPEQVRGQETDHRSDIFSFGIILHEMLSGQRTFTGDSLVELMNAILKDEPAELSETNAKISPQLDRLVRRCLEKKPERRFQTASDLGFALESLASSGYARALAGRSGEEASSMPMGDSPSKHARARAYPFVAAALLLATLAFAWIAFRRAPAESRANYTYLPWPASVSGDNGSPAFSPDGRRIAFTAVTEGTNHIWLYSLDAPEPVRVPGTEGARFPFWSPDSRHLGFFSGGKLKRIEAAGGTPESLCDVPSGFGGTWNSAGVILFAPAQNSVGLHQVSDRGGVPTPVTRLDGARLEYQHIYPRFLPDGRHFVFFVRSAQPENIGIKLGSLDQPQTSFLLRSDTNAEYSTAGYLLFLRGEKILAQRFDAEARSLRGDPVTLAEQGNRHLSADYSPLSVCEDKWLIYQSGGNPNTQLVWLDRSGRQLSLVGTPGRYRSLNLSPNGAQVIFERYEPQKVSHDIWSFDLARETFDRLTSDSSHKIFPLWSPDGKQISFGSNREGAWAIWQKGVNGNDDKEAFVFKEEARSIYQTDWSNDGKYIVYRKEGEKTAGDLWLLPLSGDRQPKPYLTTQFGENWGKVSPDGRWLVYQSNESGPNEIYVQAFPEPGRKVIVSKGGGALPRWRRDGRELYYVAPDDKLMAVPVTPGANFGAGTPAPLFEVGSYGRRNNRYVYDVSADGQRILLLRPLEDATTRPLTVVQHWTALLKK